MTTLTPIHAYMYMYSVAGSWLIVLVVQLLLEDLSVETTYTVPAPILLLMHSTTLSALTAAVH